METGFYYLQTRYYDPDIGRFISPDSLNYLEPETINGLNLYVYCLNNPVMYSDPGGNAPRWLVNLSIALAIIGGALVLASCGVLIGAATGLISVGTLAGATAVSASYGVLLGASYGALTGMQIGYELGGTEGMLIGMGMGFGIGSIGGGISGGISGANNWYNTKALEFTNFGSNEVVLGRSPYYIEVAKNRGATYFHVSNEIWEKTQSMFGVGNKGMWKINKAFLKQRIKAGASFYLASPKGGFFYAKEIEFLCLNNIPYVYL